MGQANSVSIELKVFSDAQIKTFSNGGSVVTFQAGFLESSYYSKEESKMKYKNGFITCKKNISEKLPEEKKREFTSLKKDDRVCVFGHLGFEQWERDGKKNSRVVLIIDNLYRIGGQAAQQQRPQQQRQQSYDDGPYGSDGYSGGGEDIPF